MYEISQNKNHNKFSFKLFSKHFSKSKKHLLIPSKHYQYLLINGLKIVL